MTQIHFSTASHARFPDCSTAPPSKHPRHCQISKEAIVGIIAVVSLIAMAIITLTTTALVSLIACPIIFVAVVIASIVLLTGSSTSVARPLVGPKPQSIPVFVPRWQRPLRYPLGFRPRFPGDNPLDRLIHRASVGASGNSGVAHPLAPMSAVPPSQVGPIPANGLRRKPTSAQGLVRAADLRRRPM